MKVLSRDRPTGSKRPCGAISTKTMLAPIQEFGKCCLNLSPAANKIHLAKVNTVMPQDVVGGRVVEIEIGQNV